MVAGDDIQRDGAPSRAEVIVDRVLGHDLTTELARKTVKAPLRVLAYHEIRDVGGFQAQMEHLVERYRPVDSEQVVAWLDGASLPPAAVWVTFDDADPSVVEQGLAILAQLDVPATMFVCPGVVDTDRPYWWQVVEQAQPAEVARLKVMSNDDRVRRTQDLAGQLRTLHGFELVHPQLTTDQLDRWLDSGRDIGNHTWDHPILDRCPPEEQERQIRMAHDWIMDRVAPERLLFAYPNGNPDRVADSILEDLGYQLAAMFDHRVARSRDRTRLPRLRTNADADITRFCAIVSGAHPTVHRLRGRR